MSVHDGGVARIYSSQNEVTLGKRLGTTGPAAGRGEREKSGRITRKFAHALSCSLARLPSPPYCGD